MTIFKIPPQTSPEETEKHHKPISIRIVGNLVEIRTVFLPIKLDVPVKLGLK